LKPIPRLIQPFFAVVYLIATTLLLYVLLSGWGYDDPYITYRYARNLADGVGLVFNPGERVLGLTSPLFALLLAGGARLGADIPNLARLIGAAGLSGGALALAWLARRWGGPIAAWTTLLLYPGLPLAARTLGSEMPLTLAICLAALIAYEQEAASGHGWYPAAMSLCALALFARPDTALLTLTLLAVMTVRARRIPWRAGLLYGLLILPGVAALWVYYGSPIPNTLPIKQLQGLMAEAVGFGPGLASLTLNSARSAPFWLWTGLAAAGLLTCARGNRRALVLFAWTGLHILAYCLLGVTRYFWYYAPLAPGLALVVGLGLEQMGGQLDRAWKRVAPAMGNPAAAKLRSPGAIAVILVLAGLTVLQTGQILQMRSQVDPRLAVYRKAGEWLRATARPNERVGLLEVGIIGYQSGLPVIDFAGLVTPAVGQQIQPGSAYPDLAVWAVEQYHPRFVVAPGRGFLKLRVTLSWQNCLIQQKFSSRADGSAADLEIYVCPVAEPISNR
jgi:hypothetical protein